MDHPTFTIPTKDLLEQMHLMEIANIISGPGEEKGMLPPLRADEEMDRSESCGSEGSNKLFYSLCFATYEPVCFYSKMLNVVLNYARKFDEGSWDSREVVWKQLTTLFGVQVPHNKEDNTFASLLGRWLHQPTVNLFGLELLYISFVASTSNLRANEDSLVTPWGCTLPSALLQLLLLQHWESRLEKLSSIHRKALWRTCMMMPNFNNYNVKSFRETLARWTTNPIANMNSITTLFGAIGFLKDNNILKNEFCYPKTCIPVFEDKATPSTRNKQSTPSQSDTTSSSILASLRAQSSNTNGLPLMMILADAVKNLQDRIGVSAPSTRSLLDKMPTTNSISLTKTETPLLPSKSATQEGCQKPSAGPIGSSLKRKLCREALDSQPQKRNKMEISNLIC